VSCENGYPRQKKTLVKRSVSLKQKEIREFYFVGSSNQVIFLEKYKEGGIFRGYLEKV
jgi:hypothetical protein